MPKKKVKCTLCGEELIAPARFGKTNAHEAKNVWHCANCGYVFESRDQKEPLPFVLAEQVIPNLIIA